MRTNRIIWLALTAAMFCGAAFAQDPENAPGRGVARISLLNGDVSVRRGDSGDWTAAAVNAPLVAEDRVLTGPGSRTELQFDWSNMLRVSANAEVRMAELDQQRFLVQLAKGTITWRVLRDQEAYVEISTPSVSVRPVKKGIYRVTVLEDGASEITVRSGEAEIFTPRGSERLKSGRTMMARGAASEPEYRIASEIPRDDWDRWNDQRDHDLSRTQSYSYVSRDIYGADDLDTWGRWVNVSGYGWVWSPQVAAGWAPYRSGRWLWMDWYGWSWVSYDPWGWAPYHYGRWFYSAPYGWCWYPGGLHVRQRWAPAYVAFFGSPGVGVGLGWGNVGWVPLAPYEPFHPWWGSRWYSGYRNPGYAWNNVTVVNNINVTNVYRNARIANASTWIDGAGFRSGHAGQAGRFNDADWRSVSVAHGPLPVTPDHTSLRMTDREPAARPANPPRHEQFFSARQPARVDRATFEEQRRGTEQLARHAWEASSAPGGAASTPAVTGAREAGRGWRPASPSVPTPADNSGWSRFGSARVAGREAASPGTPAAPASPRFGEPAAPAQSAAPAHNPGGRTSDGWTRFSNREPSSGTGSPAPAPTPRESRSAAPAERWSGSRSGGGNNNDSIRISPPIVRERGGGSAAPGNAGGGGRAAGSGMSSGGGARSSAPPAAVHSAPSHSSGGAGGSSAGHSSGGGSRGGGGRGR